MVIIVITGDRLHLRGKGRLKVVTQNLDTSGTYLAAKPPF